jgi:hypothetical protein
MTVSTMLSDSQSARSTGPAPNRTFAGTLFALATVLITNTVLGPLGSGAIKYPISGSLHHQVIGLEVVTVGLVVPIALVAGVLALRGHRAAALLGFGPASYAGYMFLQYVVGPEYATYTAVAFFHTAIFTLSCGTAVWAWVLGSRQPLPHLTARRRRISSAILILLAAFVLTRYIGAMTGSITGGTLPAEFLNARTFYWSIFLLDLGVVVPATIAAGYGLIRGAHAAHTALYALVTWYALVPPSVAAMSATMVVNGDPNASSGQTFLLVVVSFVFAAFAAWIYLPLMRTHAQG